MPATYLFTGAAAKKTIFVFLIQHECVPKTHLSCWYLNMLQGFFAASAKLTVKFLGIAKKQSMFTHYIAQASTQHFTINYRKVTVFSTCILFDAIVDCYTEIVHNSSLWSFANTHRLLCTKFKKLRTIYKVISFCAGGNCQLL